MVSKHNMLCRYESHDVHSSCFFHCSTSYFCLQLLLLHQFTSKFNFFLCFFTRPFFTALMCFSCISFFLIYLPLVTYYFLLFISLATRLFVESWFKKSLAEKMLQLLFQLNGDDETLILFLRSWLMSRISLILRDWRVSTEIFTIFSWTSFGTASFHDVWAPTSHPKNFRLLV